MFATMNAIENGRSYTGKFSVIGGWGGDTVQLCQDIKNFNGNENQLVLEAKKFLGLKGKFSQSSLTSDLDAPIILKKKTDNNYFADIIEKYYSGFEWKNRVKNFIKITFPEAKNKTQIRSVVYKRYKKDSYVVCLRKEEDLQVIVNIVLLQHMLLLIIYKKDFKK